MALNSPHRISIEKAATHEELSVAIEGLTGVEMKRLEIAADYRVRGLGRKAKGRNWQDLFNETVLAFFRPNGRKWKKDEVDIVFTLDQAMRSVASNWRQEFDEKEALLEAELLGKSDTDASNPLSNSPDIRESVQDRLENEERLAVIDAQLAKINEIVSQRERAALIVMGMSEGLKGPEIREDLGITEQEYETEMVWIRRKVRATFKEGRAR